MQSEVVTQTLNDELGQIPNGSSCARFWKSEIAVQIAAAAGDSDLPHFEVQLFAQAQLFKLFTP